MNHEITMDRIDKNALYSVKDNSPRGCHTAYGHTLKIGDKIVIDNYFHEITAETMETAETVETMETAENVKKRVSISKGNAKMGAIPSVSLPAGITCNPGAPCFRECYARRIEYRYKESKNAYARNYSILQADAGAYWLQVRAAAVMSRFFRFHVSGDIPSAAYFAEMVKTAELLPGTNFLAFTKQYKIVNDFITAGGCIPQNLKVIFSNWFTWKCENPHNLPVCEIIPKNGAPVDGWKVCGGNCTACACRGVGCWEIKNGETIAIYMH